MVATVWILCSAAEAFLLYRLFEFVPERTSTYLCDENVWSEAQK